MKTIILVRQTLCFKSNIKAMEPEGGGGGTDEGVEPQVWTLRLRW